MLSAGISRARYQGAAMGMSSRSMPTSGGTGGPGIGRVAVRADAIDGGRRHRVERDQKRDIDSSRDEPSVSRLAIDSHGP